MSEMNTTEHSENVVNTAAEAPAEAAVQSEAPAAAADTAKADAAAPSREERAHKTIQTYTLTSLGAGLVPLPLVDIALVSGIQLKMLHSLAGLYDQEFNKELGKSLIGALLGGILPASATGSLAKLIPGVGTLSGMISMSALSSASTYATGIVFTKHFESGGTLLSFDVEAMRGHFMEALEEGKKFVANLRKTKTPAEATK